MEALIFGAFNLATVAIFLALNALPAYLLYRAGSNWGARVNRPAIRWLLPVLPYAVAIAWVVSAFSAFQSACKAAPGVSVLSTLDGESNGFALRGTRNTFVGSAFSWDAALETGAFQFVDLEYGRRCIGKKQHERQPSFPIGAQCDKSLRSDLVVNVLPPRAVEHWWRSPISEAQIEVQDARTGRVLARATDLIFGGGVFGVYLGFFGGDQDYRHMSCGYASPGVGPWRPTLASRPRFSEYREADLRLLLAATGKR